MVLLDALEALVRCRLVRLLRRLVVLMSRGLVFEKKVYFLGGVEKVVGCVFGVE